MSGEGANINRIRSFVLPQKNIKVFQYSATKQIRLATKKNNYWVINLLSPKALVPITETSAPPSARNLIGVPLTETVTNVLSLVKSTSLRARLTSTECRRGLDFVDRQTDAM
ncbi:unnamed protein product [Gongylonema pulchrum]|uniref:WS_DGAT_C domain-containing protein n=1 Tax=Gongylonema pulchrum TaxID=637853 RepID=A0A183DGS2_9BILA|nr:unnamed protein product [Gongylonema pulchrum]